MRAEVTSSKALYRINEGRGRSVPGGGILPFGRGKPSANYVHTRCHFFDTTNEVLRDRRLPTQAMFSSDRLQYKQQGEK